MYAVGDTHSHMFPVGNDGGEYELWYVCSGGPLSDICPQWGMVNERRICVMYAVGDTHSHMFPVGDDGGEEYLCHVRSGGHSLTYVPSGG